MSFAHTVSAIFSTFNYADAVGSNETRRQQNAAKYEAERTMWLGGKAQVGYSNDGVPIVYHIPGAISKPVHVSLLLLVHTIQLFLCCGQDDTFDVLMKMGRCVKLELGGGADGSGRNTKKSYRIRRHELSGILKLVLLWHAIGHPVRFHVFFIMHKQHLPTIPLVNIDSMKHRLSQVTISEPADSFQQPRKPSPKYLSSHIPSMLSSRKSTLFNITPSEHFVKSV